MSQSQLNRSDKQRQKRQLEDILNRLKNDLQEKKHEMAQRLKVANEKLEELEKKIKELKTKRQEVIDNDLEREQIEAQIYQLNKQKDQLEKDIEETSSQVRNSESLISTLESQIEDLSELLDKLNTEDQETKSALKQKQAKLLQDQAELAHEIEKHEQMQNQIRDLQAEIDAFIGLKMNKQRKSKLQALKKELRSKKQAKGNLKSTIHKFHTLVNGLQSQIAGLSAESKRLAEQIATNESAYSSKRENLLLNQAKLRAQEQKLEKLTDTKDNTKIKIEEVTRNREENMKKDKEMKMDIEIQEDVHMKLDKSYKEIYEEVNEMKMDVKQLKRDVNEKQYQRNMMN